jgi:hypothetical protein
MGETETKSGKACQAGYEAHLWFGELVFTERGRFAREHRHTTRALFALRKKKVRNVSAAVFRS